MEISAEDRIARYQEIENSDLRAHLIDVDEYLDRRDRGLIQLSQVWKWPYCDKLRFKLKDFQWIFSDVIGYGIIDYLICEFGQDKVVTHYFDKKRFLALSSATWTIRDTFKDRKRVGDYTDIKVSRSVFPWKEIVENTKEALGNHPLTELIHEPSKEFKNAEAFQKPAPKPKPIIKERPTGIALRFPELSEGELEVLEQIDLLSLIARITLLPNGQVEEASSIKHGARREIVKALAFIDMASKGTLGNYDKNEDTCSVEALKQYLIKSRNFLLENNNKILNLKQLLGALERKIISDTDNGVSEKFYLNRHLK